MCVQLLNSYEITDMGIRMRLVVRIAHGHSENCL